MRHKPLTRTLAGAKDHPYIKRFANSSIVLYDAKQFDSVKIPVSTFTQFNLTSRQREFVESPVTAEGARTRIWYEAKGDTTSIEVFRNYLHELQEQGFAVLYDSSKDSKAGRWNGYLTAYGFGSNKLTNNRSEFVMYGAPMKSIHTLSAKREKDGQTTYVHLTTVQWDQDNKTFKSPQGRLCRAGRCGRWRHEAKHGGGHCFCHGPIHGRHRARGLVRDIV